MSHARAEALGVMLVLGLLVATLLVQSVEALWPLALCP